MNEKPKTYYSPENLSSLSAKYNVSNRTMKIWLEELYPDIIIKHKMTFSPRELEIIIEHLGSYE
ncbi:MAG: hypothetical protein B6I18_01440 [Bacteroidetes bacterium 4572_112]|nr:MAG: hypothetical protein B6I18_01440 [Bacteroidetes bacterium 4572_112]RLD44039.1 MAG: hypothetical protein DRI86_08465 [Bacteroidota bacterium]